MGIALIIILLIPKMFFDLRDVNEIKARIYHQNKLMQFELDDQ